MEPLTDGQKAEERDKLLLACRKQIEAWRSGDYAECALDLELILDQVIGFYMQFPNGEIHKVHAGNAVKITIPHKEQA